MVARKQKSYNDFELSVDIANATLTNAQIACRHGISKSMVTQIARGDARADLQPLINKISDAYLTEVKRIARARGRKIIRRLDQILDGTGNMRHAEVSLKAIKQFCALSGADKVDNEEGSLRGVVIKTPFAIDPKKVKSSGNRRSR